MKLNKFIILFLSLTCVTTTIAADKKQKDSTNPFNIEPVVTTGEQTGGLSLGEKMFMKVPEKDQDKNCDYVDGVKIACNAQCVKKVSTDQASSPVGACS